MDLNQDVELRAAITLSRRDGVGAKRFKELIERHGSPTAALAAQRAPAGASRGKTPLTVEQREALSTLPADTGATTLGAADYPLRLSRCPEPPPYLFHRGVLWPLPPVGVAIVGPRRCTPEGAAMASSLADALAAAGLPVVSGGALGIDAAAHRGALAAGGWTSLVTATGIERAYPLENERLFLEIERRGCRLTELLPGTPPRRDFFPTRNRIIAGISSAVVIIEGELESGTSSTARHALRLGRPLLTWLGSPQERLRQLPRWIIERGAARLDSADPTPILERLL